MATTAHVDSFTVPADLKSMYVANFNGKEKKSFRTLLVYKDGESTGRLFTIATSKINNESFNAPIDGKTVHSATIIRDVTGEIIGCTYVRGKKVFACNKWTDKPKA